MIFSLHFWPGECLKYSEPHESNSRFTPAPVNGARPGVAFSNRTQPCYSPAEQTINATRLTEPFSLGQIDNFELFIDKFPPPSPTGIIFFVSHPIFFFSIGR